MGKILPLLLGFIGLGAGVGAGFMLKPAPEPVAVINPCGESTAPADSAAADSHAQAAEEGTSASDFVKLNNQFIVPVVQEGSVSALVVMSLSIEVQAGQTEAVYQREPKLRDIFLQVLFDHANAGGFSGAFTTGPNMSILRQALLEAARAALGSLVIDVLITDIARQDM